MNTIVLKSEPLYKTLFQLSMVDGSCTVMCDLHKTLCPLWFSGDRWLYVHWLTCFLAGCGGSDVGSSQCPSVAVLRVPGVDSIRVCAFSQVPGCVRHPRQPGYSRWTDYNITAMCSGSPAFQLVTCVQLLGYSASVFRDCGLRIWRDRSGQYHSDPLIPVVVFWSKPSFFHGWCIKAHIEHVQKFFYKSTGKLHSKWGTGT